MPPSCELAHDLLKGGPTHDPSSRWSEPTKVDNWKRNIKKNERKKKVKCDRDRRVS